MTVVRLSLLLVASLAAFWFAGCGESEEDVPEKSLTLNEYFQRLEQARVRAEESITDDPSDGDVTSEAFWAHTREAMGVVDDLRQDFTDIPPPEEVKTAHYKFLATLEEALEFLADLTERASRAQSPGELGMLASELLEGREYQALTDRSSAACLNLQRTADERNIAVDLECQGDDNIARGYDLESCLIVLPDDISEAGKIERCLVDGRIDPVDGLAIAPGVSAAVAALPPLPPSLTGVSIYLVFEITEDSPGLSGLGIPLTERVQNAEELGLYTFVNGQWQRVADVQLMQRGKLALADFTELAENLAVLKEQG